MVNQFRETQGKIIITNEVRKNVNSFKIELDLRLINFIAISTKEKKHNQKKEKITEYKSSNEYKNLLETFPDIELIDIEKKDD